MQRLAFESAVGKRPCDANRAERVESIGILDNLAFDGAHRRRHARAFERDPGDNLTDVINHFARRSLVDKPITRRRWSSQLIAIVELPVGNVVKQSGELHHGQVGVLRPPQIGGQSPYAFNMPPIMTRAFTRKQLPHMLSGPLDEVVVVLHRHRAHSYLRGQRAEPNLRKAEKILPNGAQRSFPRGQRQVLPEADSVSAPQGQVSFSSCQMDRTSAIGQSGFVAGGCRRIQRAAKLRRAVHVNRRRRRFQGILPFMPSVDPGAALPVCPRHWRRPLLAATVALLVVAMLAARVVAAEQETPMQTEDIIRVMSFNIRFGAADDGDDHWRHRDAFLVDVVREFDPDLLGTQEALAFQVDYLCDKLPEHAMIGVGRDDGKRAGEYSAIFIRRSRFELVEQGTFWLSAEPEKPGSKAWDAALPRIASWAILRDRMTQKPFVYLNTHWDHRGERARRESARVMRDWLTKHAKGLPVLITGDFNSTESEAPYAELLSPNSAESPLQDAYRVIHPIASNEEATFHGFTGASQGQRIDWILSTAHFVVQEASIERTSRAGRFPSDHYPVTAIFRWRVDDSRGTSR